MGRRLLAISRIGTVDRHVLGLLRGGPWPGLEPAGGCEAFHALAEEAVAQGQTLFPPHALAVDDDEIRLLEWLAVAQRNRRIADIDAHFAERLAACARRLNAAGLRLRFRGDKWTRHVPVEFRARPMRSPHSNLVRSWVCDLVGRNGVASASEIVAAGVSRQYLSQLHRMGVLRRVDIGVYALPVEPGRDAVPSRWQAVQAGRDAAHVR